jgi:hypothetical protein
LGEVIILKFLPELVKDLSVFADNLINAGSTLRDRIGSTDQTGLRVIGWGKPLDKAG